MGYLGEIVSRINEALKSKLTAFPISRYSGLTNLLPRKKGTAFEYLPFDSESWLVFDDVKEMQIYHRIASSAYTQLKKDGYGDEYDNFQHAYDVDLIVMADKKKVEVGSDVLEAAIASNIPSSFKIPGISYINVYPVSANHNTRTLFGQEFHGVDYYLKPDHIFFSIRYRVELRYQKGCISLCQC